MDRIWIILCGEKISWPDEIRMKRSTKQCTFAILILFFFFTSSFVQIATRVTPRNTRSLLNQGVVYVFRGRLSPGSPARAFDRSNSRNKCSLPKQFETTQYSPPTIFHHHLLCRYNRYRKQFGKLSI